MIMNSSYTSKIDCYLWEIQVKYSITAKVVYHLHILSRIAHIYILDQIFQKYLQWITNLWYKREIQKMIKILKSDREIYSNRIMSNKR